MKDKKKQPDLEHIFYTTAVPLSSVTSFVLLGEFSKKFRGSKLLLEILRPRPVTRGLQKVWWKKFPVFSAVTLPPSNSLRQGIDRDKFSSLI